MEWVWIALALSCAWMSAISAYVGAVHYPTFHEIPAERWNAFHEAHCARTGYCVLLPIAVHSLAVAGAVVLQPQLWTSWAATVGWIFSVGWTFAVSVPLHQQLSGGKSEDAIARLVRTNHMRTLGWLASLILAIPQL